MQMLLKQKVFSNEKKKKKRSFAAWWMVGVLGAGACL
jgi:hypothetical protein